MKFSLRYIFVLVALAAILSAALEFTLRQYAMFKQDSKRDRIAFLILDYVIANGDQWPPDWESLKPHYTIRPNDDYDFQQLTEEFEIDFTLDKKTLYQIAGDPQKTRQFEPFKIPMASDQSEARDRFAFDMIINHYQNTKRYHLELRQIAIEILIRSYLADHEYQWPPNWAALQPYHAALPRLRKLDFEELPQYFTVDFSLDTATLCEIANDPKKSAQFQPVKLLPTFGSKLPSELRSVLFQDILRHYRDVPTDNRQFP